MTSSTAFDLSATQVNLLVDEAIRGDNARSNQVSESWWIDPPVPPLVIADAFRNVTAQMPQIRSWVQTDGLSWQGHVAPSRDVTVWICSERHTGFDPDEDSSVVIPLSWRRILTTGMARGELKTLPVIVCEHGRSQCVVTCLDHVFFGGIEVAKLDETLARSLHSELIQPEKSRDGRVQDLPVAVPASETEAKSAAGTSQRELDPAICRRVRSCAANHRLTPFAIVGAAIYQIETSQSGPDGKVFVTFDATARRSNDLATDLPQFHLFPDLRQAGNLPRAFAESTRDGGLLAGGIGSASLVPIVSEVRRFTRQLGEVCISVGPAIVAERRHPRLWAVRTVDTRTFITVESDVASMDSNRLLLHQASEQVQEMLASAEKEDETIRWGHLSQQQVPLEQLLHRIVEQNSSNLAVTINEKTVSYSEFASEVVKLSAMIRENYSLGTYVVVRGDRGDWRRWAVMLALLAQNRVYVPFEESRFGPNALPQVKEILDTQAEIRLTDGGYHLAPSNSIGRPSFVAIVDDEPAYVLFTSGSTGTPKPVVVGRACLANMLSWQVHRFHGGRGTKSLQFASPSFDVSVQEVLATLVSGGHLVIPNGSQRANLEALGNLIRAHGVKRIFLPFTVLEQLAALIARSKNPLRVEEVITAGEQLVITDDIRAWLKLENGVVLDNQYGPTETHVVTANRFRTSANVSDLPRLPSIGTPISNTGLVLLDKSGPVPLWNLGKIGEICVVGAAVGMGYADKSDGGFCRLQIGANDYAAYRTGDMGQWNADSSIRFRGRLDQQVKLNGIRTELGEVESRLTDLICVRAAVATTVESQQTRLLVVFVVLADGYDDSALEIRHRLRLASTPSHMVPWRIVVVDEIPVSAHGKADRARLVQELLLHPSSDPAPTEKLSTSDTLERVWVSVLGTPLTDENQSFFSAGGDSLAAVRLIREVSDLLNVLLPLSEFFQEPSFAGLCRIVDARPGAGQ